MSSHSAGVKRCCACRVNVAYVQTVLCATLGCLIRSQLSTVENRRTSVPIKQRPIAGIAAFDRFFCMLSVSITTFRRRKVPGRRSQKLNFYASHPPSLRRTTHAFEWIRFDIVTTFL